MTFAQAVRDWHDFFVALAECSASLSGLLFVAVTLRPAAVTDRGMMESRAFTSLVGLLSVTFTSLLVLMPQPFTRWAVVVAGLAALGQLLHSLPRRRLLGQTRISRVRRAIYDVTLSLVIVAGGMAAAEFEPRVAFVAIASAQLMLVGLAAGGAWLLVSPSESELHLMPEEERPAPDGPARRRAAAATRSRTRPASGSSPGR